MAAEWHAATGEPGDCEKEAVHAPSTAPATAAVNGGLAAHPFGAAVDWHGVQPSAGRHGDHPALVGHLDTVQRMPARSTPSTTRPHCASTTWERRSMKPKELSAHNIVSYGHHIYLVSGDASPRFAYTIGLSEPLGAELVLPGGAVYTAQEIIRIVNGVAQLLRVGAAFDTALEVETLGSFRLRRACAEWVRALMLGALDYHKTSEVSAYQIIPDQAHWTVDTPSLESPWSAATEPVWRWFFEPWPFVFPRKSIAATNLDALRGRRITQAARWEDDLWEIFAGADVTREQMRPVPLGVLLGADATLRAVLDLDIGQELQRNDDELAWRPWTSEPASSK